MALRVSLIFAAAILAVSVLYAGSRPAEAKDQVASRGSESPVAGGSGPNTVTFTLDEAKHALEYWTPKRMANATPMPLAQGSPSPRGIFDQLLPPNSSSPPVRGAAPVSPSGHTNNGRLRQGAGPEVITPAEHANPAEWTGPLTSPPATTTGKLFVWFDFKHTPNNPNDDEPSECSASTVKSPAKNLVFTAGHCLLNTPEKNGPWSTRGWARKITFVPDYPYRTTTGLSTSYRYGEWAAQNVVVPEEWAESGDRRYDVAAIQVWPSDLTGGELLVDEVGANGIRFNEPAQQDAYVFGYPSNYANGVKLYYCHDRSEWGGVFNPRPWVLCDFGPGASGGPWLMNFNGETGDLFSVTSTECKEGQIYSPFCDTRGNQGPLFEESIAKLYNDIVGTDVPSPGSIAYTRYDGHDQEIYTISPTGETPFQVTNNTTNEFDPSLSPDGTKIAYSGYDGNDQEIYTINSLRGTPFPVTNNTTGDGAPSYSPDGTHIAYEGDDGHDQEIYTISPTGGTPFKVTDVPMNHYSPAYSPDGTKIAYYRRECTRCDTEIFTKNSTGGSTSFQVTDNTTGDYDPTYYPISKWIAFSGSDGKDHEIFRVFSPEDTSTHYEPRQITYNDTDEFEASYSPDGLHIVYSGYDGHDYELYTLNLIYGHVRKLTNTDTDENSPSWGIARKTEVPDVVGSYSSGAGQRIRNAGLVPKFTGGPPGKNAWVVSQSPRPRTVVDRGSTVTCRLIREAPN